MAPDGDLAVFRAISDPTRRQLLEALRAGPLSVNRMAEAFPVSRPAISKHLRCLRQAGLVSEERSGRQRIYRLQPKALDGVLGWVEGFAARPEGAGPAAAGRRRAGKPVRRPQPAPSGGWRVW